MNKRSWAWAIGGALAVVAGFYALWYFQSPVGSGVYPGRVGGVQFLDSNTYKLPVVWVRQYPWERFPPRMAEAQLIGEGGQVVGRSVFARPEGPKVPVQSPVWVQPRAIMGAISLPFPEAGVKATAVSFIWEDGRTETYDLGPIRLEKFSDPTPALWSTNQWERWVFEPYEMEGNYLWPVGPGTLVDVISAMPGMEGTPQGLLYREGQDPDSHSMQAPYRESGAYKPLTLPMEVREYITIYLPFSDEAKARLRDTHYSARHALVYRTAEGKQVTVPATGYTFGVADQNRWRSWVPFFVYEPRQP